MLRALRVAYALRSVWAIIAALLAGSVLIALAGFHPFAAYSSLFQGAFADYYGFGNTLTKMCPLIFAGLAVALPLRAGLFNIGGEGQIYMGALFATLVGLYMPAMPGAVHILVASLAAALGGALWALVPALLKAYRGLNELILTLLMNYIAINIVGFLVSGPMRDEGAPYPYSPELPEALFLPHILPRTDAHIGVVIGIGFAVALFLAFRHMTVGYTLSAVGRNLEAARYAGISVRRQIVLAMVSGGALAGLGGGYEVLGLQYRLFAHFSPGYGFDGIVVAFLANLEPLFVIVASLFIAALRAGANIMQRTVGLETTVVDAIEGLVIIFVALSLAFRFSDSRLANALRRRQDMDEQLRIGKETTNPGD